MIPYLKLFDGLAGHDGDFVTSDEIITNMEAALKPWREAESPQSSPEIDDLYDLKDVDLFKEEEETRLRSKIELEDTIPENKPVFKEEL